MNFSAAKPKTTLLLAPLKYWPLFFLLSAHAVSIPSPETDTVKGRAPAALEVLISNQSAPGKPPSPDSVLNGSYAYSDEDTDLEEGTRFQWKRGSTDISGATSVTYTVQPSDDNQTLTFQVTPGSVATSDPDSGSPTLSSPLQVSSFPPVASSVVVSGLNLVGNPLAASYTYDDPNGDLEGSTLFQWFRNSILVPGATSRMFNLTAADEGSVIAFEVTPVSLTGGLKNGAAVRSADSPVIAASQGSAPQIRSAMVVGEIVVGGSANLNYDYFDADGDLEGNSLFQWQSNESGSWVDIQGATDQSYVLQTSQETHQVRAVITPVSRTGAPSTGQPFTTSSSGAVQPSSGSAPVATSVLATGTRKVGQTLTGSYVYSDADGDLEGATKTQWYRGCSGMSYCIAIPGATGLTYTLQDEDEGAYVLFQVVPKSSTGTPNTGTYVNAVNLERIAPREGAAPVASNVTMTGTRTVGQTLTGHYVYSDVDGDAEGASSLVWWRGTGPDPSNSYAIPGATGRTYVLQAADEGKQVRFFVTPKALTGTPIDGVEAKSDTGELIAPIITNLRIEKPTAARNSFEVFYNFSSGGSGTATYQWHWRGSPIPDATGKIHRFPTLTQPSASVPEELSVVVTPRSTGGVTGNAATARISLRSTFNWGFMAPVWGPGNWVDVQYTCQLNGATLPASVAELQSLVSALGNLSAYGVNIGANYWVASNGTAANTKQTVRVTDGAGFDSVPQSASNAGICKR